MEIDENNKGLSSNTKTILVAEDEDVNFLFLEIVLNNIGVKVLHAKNGKEAVELCKNHREIDLALIDIKMPVMNGLDATNEIKKLRPDLPIIAQTAYALESDKKLYQNYGFDEYITKPIDKNHLSDVIQKYLD